MNQSNKQIIEFTYVLASYSCVCGLPQDVVDICSITPLKKIDFPPLKVINCRESLGQVWNFKTIFPSPYCFIFFWFELVLVLKSVMVSVNLYVHWPFCVWKMLFPQSLSPPLVLTICQPSLLHVYPNLEEKDVLQVSQ